MKKRMKQFSSLFLALAMTLSLSVTAFAANAGSGGGFPGEQKDQVSVVRSEGALPADVVDIVMPTAPATAGAGLFSMIFDSHGMINRTGADRFATANNGRGVTDIDTSRFFFKNNVKTVNDVPYELAVGFGTGNDYIADGTTVVKFQKPASTGLITIVAKPGPDGKFAKWVTDTGADISSADWGGTYSDVAALKDLDPASGYGLDAIAKLNQEHPNLYVQNAGAHGTITGATKYTYIKTYDDSSVLYVVFNEDGTVKKAFTTLGTAPSTPPTAASANPTLSDVEDTTNNTINVKNGKATLSSTEYFRELQYTAILSLKKTSAPLTVINKTNAKIGVTMGAELTNLPGGDGKKDTNNNPTYVYAKAMDSGKFYDGPVGESTTNEIVGGQNGVPVFFFTLSATDNAATQNTSTEVIAYNSTAQKATVSIGAAIEGRDDVFAMEWDGANEDTGNYQYVLADTAEAYAMREADFNAMTFQFEGAIDADNDVWDTFGTNPALTVTWQVEAYQDVAPPTVDKPAAIKATMATTFTVSDNPENAVLVKVTQGGTEIAESNLSISNDTTTGGTTSVMVNKGVITGYEDVVFTFQAQDKAFRTVDVTLSYT